jgi:hypothetical protein
VIISGDLVDANAIYQWRDAHGPVNVGEAASAVMVLTSL